MLTEGEESVIRAATALQVAALEHAKYGATRQQSVHAMIECCDAIRKAIGDIRREDRTPTKEPTP